METWMWISLYVVQTFVGAVLWRKYITSGFWMVDSGLLALVPSGLILPNAIVLIILSFKWLDRFIDFLAGIKSKETEGIKCTGNNGNGCFMDSCGHNCGCQGIGDKN